MITLLLFAVFHINSFLWLVTYLVCLYVTSLNILLLDGDERVYWYVPSQVRIWGILRYSLIRSSGLLGGSSLQWFGKVVAQNFPSGKYLTFKSPIAILSLIRKYMTRMCLFQFALNNNSLLLRSMALKLSWYMTTSSTSNPCASIKCLYHSNVGITLSALISSASVELLGYIFFS